MYWKNILFIRELHIAVEFYNKMVAFISAFKFILTILLLLVVWDYVSGIYVLQNDVFHCRLLETTGYWCHGPWVRLSCIKKRISQLSLE